MNISEIKKDEQGLEFLRELEPAQLKDSFRFQAAPTDNKAQRFFPTRWGS